MPVGHGERDARGLAQPLDEEQGDGDALGRELGHAVDGAEDAEDRVLRWAADARLGRLHEVGVGVRVRVRVRVGVGVGVGVKVGVGVGGWGQGWG